MKDLFSLENLKTVNFYSWLAVCAVCVSWLIFKVVMELFVNMEVDWMPGFIQTGFVLYVICFLHVFVATAWMKLRKK